MRLAILTLLCAGALGLCLAVPEKTVRWCVMSDQEATKCFSLLDNLKKVFPKNGPTVVCVKKASYLECIRDISENKADAVTIDGALMFEDSLPLYNLKPIVAEYYGSKDDPQTYYYAVAMVKKGSGFQLNQLQGKKSCHTGLGWSAGWYIPLSILHPSGSLETAAATFFSSSCVPCADERKFPSLCKLCAGKGADKCTCSSLEPYFGYSGAFKCLQDGVGDVSFVRHLTVFEVLPDKADRDQFELLCPDNTRRPVDEYEQCHLAQVPSHAVMTRRVNGKEDSIWEILRVAQENFGKDKSSEFQLFGSPHGKDLLFTDATHGFLRVPPKMDLKLYLEDEYYSIIRNLKTGLQDSQKVKWCAVAQQERAKCDQWSAVSGGAMACTTEETAEDCIAAIMKGEADAMSLDGGQIYIAGQCGLVPVLGENYLPIHGNGQLGSKCVNAPLKGYYVVAVVKKSDADITWNSLRGKKSCHTAVGTSAGWNIPMGLIYNETGSCKFDEFFSSSCAPGSNPDSHLCALCAGSDNPGHVCVPNSHERYYGSSGALRCLVEKGDVAFMKHPTVLQNTDGKNPEAWAKGLKQEDFQLLCLDGTRKPVTEAQSCHLAKVPSHAVVSRKDRADFVRRILFNQQIHLIQDQCLLKKETPSFSSGFYIPPPTTGTKGHQGTVSLEMESVAFENVAVNFSLEACAMLNPSQKNLYKHVIPETLRNQVFVENIWKHTNIENKHQNPLRKPSCQPVDKLCEYKESQQCVEIFNFTTEGIVNHQCYSGIHRCESSGCAKVVIDHISLNVLLKLNSGHRSHEDWEYGKKLYKNKH